jgi:hypothetical protein
MQQPKAQFFGLGYGMSLQTPVHFMVVVVDVVVVDVVVVLMVGRVVQLNPPLTAVVVVDVAVVDVVDAAAAFTVVDVVLPVCICAWRYSLTNSSSFPEGISSSTMSSVSANMHPHTSSANKTAGSLIPYTL